MLIQSMTRQASNEILERAKLGRLGCAREGQPYVTPILFAYSGNHLYSFSTLGQKVEWMRTNPLVCLEVEEITSREDWATVIVFGRYEELPDTPAYEADRQRAYDLLRRRPAWWEPGFVRTVLDGKERSLEPVYFRISIDTVNGHRGIPGR